MLPVYGAGVERKRSQVGLAGQGAGEVAWNVALLGEENSVPTQLRHNIFPAQTEPCHHHTRHNSANFLKDFFGLYAKVGNNSK
jgi:hypothetical protein